MLTERPSRNKYLIPIIFLSVIAVIVMVTAVIQTDNLSKTRDTLASTQTELSNTQNNLIQTNIKLNTTQMNLSQTQTNLAITQNELAATSSNLTQTRTQLTAVSSQLATAQTNLAQVQTNLAAEQTQLTAANDQVSSLQVDINRMATGYGYVLKDPSYAQMQSFLAADQTDKRTYDVNNYNCVNFSADVKANAAKQKIRCAVVYVDFPSTSHDFVAFNTTDRGLIYIEPQSDDQVVPQVGKRYYQCEILPPGYRYTTPSYDDTIVRFIVIW